MTLPLLTKESFEKIMINMMPLCYISSSSEVVTLFLEETNVG